MEQREAERGFVVDIQELNRRAVRQSVEIVSSAREEQWDLPTPCAQWNLRQLLAHMTAQNNGFAAAADGETEDDSVWREQPTADPGGDYLRSAERVISAFDGPDVMGREFWLPEIRRVGGFPARMAISFHFLDYVVHGWDVGAALGAPPKFDDDIVEAALEVTRRAVPVGPSRSLPGSPFAPPLPEEGSDQDRLLRLLGRSPAWPA
ncbi:TIGR03086 family metal-binding protein [Micromonospora sp. WMMD734]|uniref:TIGR03086 family metal-binding protein n=1 Tax=Micromonospora sp. WMMD734 TaxID=3404129 RepID=UPI003B927CC5